MTEEAQRKPKRLHPAGIILWGMRILALFRVPRRMIEAHFALNALAWKAHLQKLGQIPFIEDQNAMSDFCYGRERRWLTGKLLGGRNLCAKENACEVIAVYNALLSLSDGKETPDFAMLLRHFERSGISLWGYFGTSIHAVVRYFQASPYQMLHLRGRQITKEALRKACRDHYTCCIMMAENKAGDLKEMVHTICISREETEDGSVCWRAHNDYEGSVRYESLEDAVFGYHRGQGRALGVLLLSKADVNPIL
ncbi:MAG: hypothetical protein K6E18_02650 [Lachnospiraceae bacterium]|nr:hypothetical protein [Lachnospiraceae bacterium]